MLSAVWGADVLCSDVDNVPPVTRERAHNKRFKKEGKQDGAESQEKCQSASVCVVGHWISVGLLLLVVVVDLANKKNGERESRHTQSTEEKREGGTKYAIMYAVPIVLGTQLVLFLASCKKSV